MIDYTKLIKKLDKDPNGEDPGLRLRTAVVDAVNPDNTVDLLLSGGLVPDVPVLDGAVVSDGAVVQVLVARGSILVLGGSASGGSGKAQAFNGNNPTFSSTTYISLTSGDIAGVTFVAPASGAVKITISGWLGINSTNLRCRVYMTGQVRQGSVINSGTVVDAANDDQAAIHDNESTGGYTYEYGSVPYVVSGLTPGDDYNVTIMHRVLSSPVVTTGAGTFKRRILVEPW